MKKITVLFFLVLGAVLRVSAMQYTNSANGTVDTRDYKLIVESNWGTPIPGVGTNVYDWHETVEFWTYNVMEGETILHIVDGYFVTGVPAVFGEYHGTVVLSNLTYTLSWNWVEDFLVSTTNFGSGWVSPSFQWVRNGSNTTFTAEPGYGFLFTGWSGDGSGGPSATNLNYTVIAPALLVANFSTDPDGDGLVNTNEWAVGADPWLVDTDSDGFNDKLEFDHNWNPTVSDQWAVDYIQNNSGTFGLYASNSVLDVAVGQILIKTAGGTASLNLQLQQSEDLVTWTNAGDVVEWSVPVDRDKQFFRVRSAP